MEKRGCIASISVAFVEAEIEQGAHSFSARANCWFLSLVPFTKVPFWFPFFGDQDFDFFFLKSLGGSPLPSASLREKSV